MNSSTLDIQELFISDLFHFLNVVLGSGCSRGFCAVQLHGYCWWWLFQGRAVFLVIGTSHHLHASVMATVHTSQRWLANVMLSTGFGLKSGTRLSRWREAASEQPQESDLHVVLFRLHIVAQKVIK